MNPRARSWTWRMALAALCVPGAAPAGAQLTVRVTQVPAETPSDAAIYAAGSFNNWNPADSAYRLVERGGVYSLTLPQNVRGYVEFKFTLGSWARMEATSAGDDLPNRAFTVPDAGAASYTGMVEGWRGPGTRRSTATRSVSVLDTAFAIPQLGRTRRVWIYLPPDYATSGRRYRVLYMHDGQNVFDASTSYTSEWGVDESLDSLHALGDPGVIVVAVDNGEQRRTDEYSPWTRPGRGGGEGDEHADFVAHTLKPWVDRHYRTRPERESTGVMGGSMGGLIALYTALRHPNVFGRAGVFSPSLWFSDSVFTMARAAAPVRPGPRFYFVSGGREGRLENPLSVLLDQRRMFDTLVAAGFTPGVEIRAAEDAGGTHSEWFWRRQFPAAYRWLFSGDDDPCAAAGAARR